MIKQVVFLWDESDGRARESWKGKRFLNKKT
jgi:hypothetical protein